MTGDWDKLVSNLPGSTFFQTTNWLETLREAYGYKIHYLKSDVGILPLVEVNSRIFGHRLISIAFCEYGPINASARLYDNAFMLKDEVKAKYVEIRSANSHPGGFAVQATHDTSRIIFGHKDDIWVGFHKRLKNSITSALKKNKHIEIYSVGGNKSTVKRFYDFYFETQFARGTPTHSLKFFQTLLCKDGVHLWLAEQNNKLLTAILIFGLNDRYNWWGNYIAEGARGLGLTPEMLWLFIKERSELSPSNFSLDLGRARVGSSVDIFKSQFGGATVDLYRSTDTTVKLAYPTDPNFELASMMWKMLRRPAARRLGPQVMKGIAL